MSIKKGLPIIIFIAAAVAGLFIFGLSQYQNLDISIYRNGEISKSRNVDISKFRDSASSTITLLAVGDIMLSRGVQYKIETQGQGDFLFPFLKIAPELSKADIVFGNLEGPISEKGQRVGSIYSFRAKPEVMAGLVFVGFDVLSLANNHMFDYQRISLEETMRLLTAADIDYVGAGYNQAEAFSLKIKEVKGVKIGFLSYTDLGSASWQAGETLSGIAWIDETWLEKIKRDIADSKRKTDILIVSLHSGEEYAQDPTAFQISFAKDCVDSGADLVVEHHSHTLQRLEQYKDGWVAYCLGNFVFDQYFPEDTMQGGLLSVEIKNKKIISASLRKVQLNRNYQPELSWVQQCSAC